MPAGTKTQMTTQVNDYLLTWVDGFLVDRKARGLTNNTLLYYTRKLKQFHQYAEGQAVDFVPSRNWACPRGFMEHT